MDMTSINGIMDLIVLAAGLYILYGYYLLAAKKEFKDGLLVSERFPAKTCKDKEGYAAYIGLPTLLLGLGGVLSGAIGLYQDYVGPVNRWLYLTGYVVFAAVLVWFIVRTKKAQGRFW